MTRRRVRTPTAASKHVSSSEQERRWIDAWSAVYELEARHPGSACLLPDGDVVDSETGRAWLQRRAYEQHALHVAVTHERTRVLIVLTSTAPA